MSDQQTLLWGIFDHSSRHHFGIPAAEFRRQFILGSIPEDAPGRKETIETWDAWSMSTVDPRNPNELDLDGPECQGEIDE